MSSSAPPKSGRKFDIVVLGATGFTGKLVAEYLHTSKAPVKWAIAGRSQKKLDSVNSELNTQIPTIVADSDDIDSLNALAEQTKVVITTVGPYALHGTKLVEACVTKGTDCVDLTGESLWVEDIIAKYHDKAVQTGARIVPSCGFDSIPADLGAFMMCEYLRRVHQTGAQQVSYYCGKMKGGGASGGTIASVKGIAEKVWNEGSSVLKRLNDPYLLTPPPKPAVSNPIKGSGFAYNSEIKGWTAPFIFAGHDSKLVFRSNALLDGMYGQNLHYREVIPFKGRLMGFIPAALVTVSIGIGSLLMYVPVTRHLLMRFLPLQGQGPSKEKRDSGCFWINLTATGENGVRVKGKIGSDLGDCGYKGTSIMLSECALTLALESDRLSSKGGILTTASALGVPLMERLNKAGVVCEVHDADTDNSKKSS